jgi:hypothetical protein
VGTGVVCLPWTWRLVAGKPLRGSSCCPCWACWGSRGEVRGSLPMQSIQRRGSHSSSRAKARAKARAAVAVAVVAAAAAAVQSTHDPTRKTPLLPSKEASPAAACQGAARRAFRRRTLLQTRTFSSSGTKWLPPPLRPGPQTLTLTASACLPRRRLRWRGACRGGLQRCRVRGVKGAEAGRRFRFFCL